MAKVLHGSTIGDIRGSVGAGTHTKGRFGAVMRQKVSPVQPRSASVLKIRAFFSTLSKNWANTLTDEMRAGWNALAAVTTYTNVFGNTYHPTGLQLYQSCNRNLQLIGAPLITDAPDNLDVDDPLTLAVSASAGGGTLSAAFSPSPFAAGLVLAFDGTPQFNQGVSNVGQRYKYLTAVADPTPANLAAAYTALFGALRLNQKIGIRCWFIKWTTGAASQVISDLVTVAA